jgi:aristolochene synthase
MLLEVPRELSFVKEMEIIAGYHAALVNDLFSYRREVAIMDKGKVSALMVNAVTVVMNERELSEVDAIRWLEEYVVKLEEDFEGKIVAAKQLGEEVVARYAQALEQLMAGNLKWSIVCGRYNRLINE